MKPNIITIQELQKELAKNGYNRTIQMIHHKLKKFPGGDPTKGRSFGGVKYVYKTEIPAITEFLKTRWGKLRED